MAYYFVNKNSTQEMKDKLEQIFKRAEREFKDNTNIERIMRKKRSALKKGSVNFLLNIIKDKPIGYLQFTTHLNAVRTRETYVIPEKRGKNIASKLTFRLSAWARRKGYKKIIRTYQLPNMLKMAKKMKSNPRQSYSSEYQSPPETIKTNEFFGSSRIIFNEKKQKFRKKKEKHKRVLKTRARK